MTEDRLKCALQNCSLYSLILVTCKVLAHAGFGDFEILDRRHSRQKSRYGGFELECHTHLGPVPVKTVVKVVRDSVRQRMLDELAGAVIRSNAGIGLLIATKHVSNRARRNGERYGPLRLQVVDGDTLAALLSQYSIGVRKDGEVDYRFFGGLEMEAIRHITSIAETR